MDFMNSVQFAYSSLENKGCKFIFKGKHYRVLTAHELVTCVKVTQGTQCPSCSLGPPWSRSTEDLCGIYPTHFDPGFLWLMQNADVELRCVYKLGS